MAGRPDDPRDKPRGTWARPGTDHSAATALAGTIMSLVAMTLLFDADEDEPERPEPSGDPDPSTTP